MHDVIEPGILNDIYNLSDCYLSLSSEGFGLPTLEAMATKLPCILLNHSASAATKKRKVRTIQSPMILADSILVDFQFDLLFLG